MLRTTDLDYDLPPGLIAIHPEHPRDAARLMVVSRSDPDVIQDMTVRDLPQLLRAGDLLVFNSTRVLPARFRGTRWGTGGKIDGLYLHDLPGPGLVWAALIKGRHTRAGAILDLSDRSGGPSPVSLEVLGRAPDEPEAWAVRVIGEDSGTGGVLDVVGLTPLPPYILKARRDAGDPGGDEQDRLEYQTVFARESGSVAAPTAGLHFTPELLAALERGGIRRAEVTLHVGTGTFRPVETEFVEQHPMHSEWCTMPAETLAAIQETRGSGGRVIAVGTTAARTIESYAAAVGESGGRGEPPAWLRTSILITPGYEFRWTDGLLTNFHLPRSTLMAMVGAMLPGEGIGRLRALYARAIDRGYRFYSFGDAMLIL